ARLAMTKRELQAAAHTASGIETPLGQGRIGPHNGRELEFLLAGIKPAAILYLDDERAAVRAGLLVRQRGARECLAAHDACALQRLRLALEYGDSVSLGLALGYSQADVCAFLIVNSGVEPDDAARIVRSTNRTLPVLDRLGEEGWKSLAARELLVAA